MKKEVCVVSGNTHTHIQTNTNAVNLQHTNLFFKQKNTAQPPSVAPSMSPSIAPSSYTYILFLFVFIDVLFGLKKHGLQQQLPSDNKDTHTLKHTQQNKDAPSKKPTPIPTTSEPTLAPSLIPSESPSNSPTTLSPTVTPTQSPSNRPTSAPTDCLKTVELLLKFENISWYQWINGNDYSANLNQQMRTWSLPLPIADPKKVHNELFNQTNNIYGKIDLYMVAWIVFDLNSDAQAYVDSVNRRIQAFESDIWELVFNTDLAYKNITTVIESSIKQTCTMGPSFVSLILILGFFFWFECCLSNFFFF